MSRYHQVPRDSMESEDREAREFLIPSPVSNVLSVSGLPATRSCSFRPSIYLRIFSSVCALVGLLVVTINQPFVPALISMAVFFGLIIATNSIRLVSMPFTGQSNLRFAIYYKDRDILARPDGSHYRPSFFTFLDVAWCVALLVSTTIWKAQFNVWWFSVDGAIVGSVFAGIVIFIQLVISIPVVDRLGVTVRDISIQDSQRIFLGASVVQPVANDRKDPVMTGAVDVQPEQSAITPPVAAGQDASNLV